MLLKLLIWESKYFPYFSRVKELEAELDSEQRRMGDATKNFRKADRGIKEYTFRQEEDRKNAERMQDLVDKLQQQVREKSPKNFPKKSIESLLEKSSSRFCSCSPFLLFSLYQTNKYFFSVRF